MMQATRRLRSQQLRKIVIRANNLSIAQSWAPVDAASMITSLGQLSRLPGMGSVLCFMKIGAVASMMDQAVIDALHYSEAVHSCGNLLDCYWRRRLQKNEFRVEAQKICNSCVENAATCTLDAFVHLVLVSSKLGLSQVQKKMKECFSDKFLQEQGQLPDRSKAFIVLNALRCGMLDAKGVLPILASMGTSEKCCAATLMSCILACETAYRGSDSCTRGDIQKLLNSLLSKLEARIHEIRDSRGIALALRCVLPSIELPRKQQRLDVALALLKKLCQCSDDIRLFMSVVGCFLRAGANDFTARFAIKRVLQQSLLPVVARVTIHDINLEAFGHLIRLFSWFRIRGTLQFKQQVINSMQLLVGCIETGTMLLAPQIVTCICNLLRYSQFQRWFRFPVPRLLYILSKVPLSRSKSILLLQASTKSRVRLAPVFLPHFDPSRLSSAGRIILLAGLANCFTAEAFRKHAELIQLMNGTGRLLLQSKDLLLFWRTIVVLSKAKHLVGTVSIVDVDVNALKQLPSLPEHPYPCLRVVQQLVRIHRKQLDHVVPFLIRYIGCIGQPDFVRVLTSSTLDNLLDYVAVTAEARRCLPSSRQYVVDQLWIRIVSIILNRSEGIIRNDATARAFVKCLHYLFLDFEKPAQRVVQFLTMLLQKKTSNAFQVELSISQIVHLLKMTEKLPIHRAVSLTNFYLNLVERLATSGGQLSEDNRVVILRILRGKQCWKCVQRAQEILFA